MNTEELRRALIEAAARQPAVSLDARKRIRRLVNRHRLRSGCVGLVVVALLGAGLWVAGRDTTRVSTVDGPRAIDRFVLGPDDVVGDAFVTSDSLWVAFRRGDAQPAYHLARFDLRTTDLRRVYDLPGEVGSGGITATRTRLWLATINEFDPTGTALLSLDLATDDLQSIATLEGASNLATDGQRLWVRGEWRLQVRDAVTGRLLAERNAPELGFGWVASGPEGTWMTNRAANALQQLDGIEITRSVRLLPSETTPDRLAIGGGTVVVAQGDDIVLVNSQSGTIEARINVGEAVNGVAMIAKGVVAISGGRILVYDRESGSKESIAVAGTEPPVTVIADGARSAITCTPNVCERLPATHPIGTPQNAEGWFARPSFLPPGFTLVDEPRQANADQTHDVRYRRGAPLTRDVAVIDMHSYRGAIDIGLSNWPGRVAHEVEVRGHRALFIVTLPEQPDRGLRIVSWQEQANLGVTISATGSLDEATLLDVAESIRFGD